MHLKTERQVIKLRLTELEPLAFPKEVLLLATFLLANHYLVMTLVRGN